ncbi:MAG: lamin tail domain-containing protein [Salinivirgaceae bacterium]|nr:lamin tail domain-containing protein [Salinivirgaceae bacterium]
MKKLLLSLSFLGLILSMNAQTDLFFSEYIEGSGNNKALEIYNPTDATIDLSAYYVVRFSNGDAYPANLDPTTTDGGYCQLIGTLAPGACHVLVNGQTTGTSSSPACSPELQALADQLDVQYPAPTYMNGNDAIGLMKKVGSNYLPVDIFGQIGMLSTMDNSLGWTYVKDSTITYTMSGVEATATISDYAVPKKANDNTTYGPFWMAMSMNHTLIRKPFVVDGITANPDGFNVLAEWDTVGMSVGDTAWTNQDIWKYLGTHNEPVGIQSTKNIQGSFNVYPNPVTNNSFTITASGNISSVKVYNTIGKLVHTENSSFASRAFINLRNVSKGFYFVTVELENNTKTLTQKIVLN